MIIEHMWYVDNLWKTWIVNEEPHKNFKWHEESIDDQNNVSCDSSCYIYILRYWEDITLNLSFISLEHFWNFYVKIRFYIIYIRRTIILIVWLNCNCFLEFDKHHMKGNSFELYFLVWSKKRKCQLCESIYYAHFLWCIR